MALSQTVGHGDRTELLAAAEIVSAGGVVSVPFGHAQGYDLVSDFDGALSRVQVRLAWYRGDRDRWDVAVDEHQTFYEEGNRRLRKVPCGGERYDFLAVLAGITWYIIPVTLLVGRSYLTLRPPECRKRTDSGVHPVFDVESYREAWPLLKGGVQ